MKPYNYSSCSILGCGTVSLKTGKFYGMLKGENITTFWEGGSLHVYKFGNQYKLVSSSGSGHEWGRQYEFHHDQSMRNIGYGTYLGAFENTIEGLKGVKEVVKTSAVAVYCFK